MPMQIVEQHELAMRYDNLRSHLVMKAFSDIATYDNIEIIFEWGPFGKTNFFFVTKLIVFKKF